MQFIYPLFLFALFSLAIPILIHLFNFRKFKKVYFTNVRILTDIQQETKRHSRLKQLLILAARLLALSCLVIAFARPVITSSPRQSKKAGKHAVSIYIDNSFSMEAIGTEGRLFDAAKLRAVEIAGSYQPSDLFQILTNDFEGRHQRFYSREEFTRMVEEVRLSPAPMPLSSIIRRQNDMLAGTQTASREAFLISDFQRSFSDIISARPDTSDEWYLIPLSAEQRKNLYIDTISFESTMHRPGQVVRLKVHLSNAGDESLERVPVKLTINKTQKSVANFSVKANSGTEVILPYTENDEGIQFGTLEIPDYPLTYDDRFFFTYPVIREIPVLCINGSSDNHYLRSLFNSDSSFRLVTSPLGKVDYNSFGSYSLIILNEIPEVSTGLTQKCKEFAAAGGSLLVFPSVKMNLENFNIFLSNLTLPLFLNLDTSRQSVTKIALESDFYKDVFDKARSGQVVLPENTDFPEVFRSYTMVKNTTGTEEELINLRDGRPMLSLVQYGKGKVYLFSLPLSEQWSNFPRHMLFLPTIYQVAFMSIPGSELYYPVGKNEITLRGDSISEKEQIRIRNNNSGVTFIPGIRNNFSQLKLKISNQVVEAGLYTLLSGEKPLQGLAFNYNRQESDTRCLSEKEIKKEISTFASGNIHLLSDKKYPVADQIRKINEGTPLWKWFILMTLLFIAAEILIIRFVKE
ncbi:MAG: BatA domain-containing protein [bacterium]